MDLLNTVENLTDDMYQRLLCAVETGKWPEGTPVDKAQQETAMLVVMAYQSRVLKSTENMTIGENGEIVEKSKKELKQQFKTPSTNTQTDNDQNSIARFTNL